MAALKRSIEARQGAKGAPAAAADARARKPALAKGKAKGGGSKRASR
jgi:hypothetical protein